MAIIDAAGDVRVRPVKVGRPDRTAVNAVTPQALRDVLEHYGSWDDFERGLLTCAATGAVVTTDNLGQIQLRDGALVFYCSGFFPGGEAAD